jgi:hypothetical protein
MCEFTIIYTLNSVMNSEVRSPDVNSMEETVNYIIEIMQKCERVNHPQKDVGAKGYKIVSRFFKNENLT